MAKAKSKDDQIHEYLEQLKLVEKEIKAKTEVKSLTNKIFKDPLTQTTYNLNTLDAIQLVYLRTQLTLLDEGLNDLKITSKKVNGYEIADWLEDISNLVTAISYREKRTLINSNIKKLETMFSEEFKNNKTLDDVKSLIDSIK